MYFPSYSKYHWYDINDHNHLCESTFFSFSHTDEFQIAFMVECQSDSTIQCQLSREISAVDMEIRWFKETDCVCFYKNRRLIEGERYKGIMSLCIKDLERGIVSLQLKDESESYVGDYLCQVTRGDRTVEITIRKCECFIYCSFILHQL